MLNSAETGLPATSTEFLSTLVKNDIFATLISAVIIGIICGVLASQKGRSVVGWVILSIFLGLIAALILVFLSDLHCYYDSTTHTDDVPLEKLWTCTYCGAENCGGNFCSNCFKQHDTDKRVELPVYQGKKWVCDYCGAHNDETKKSLQTLQKNEINFVLYTKV